MCAACSFTHIDLSLPPAISSTASWNLRPEWHFKDQQAGRVATTRAPIVYVHLLVFIVAGQPQTAAEVAAPVPFIEVGRKGVRTTLLQQHCHVLCCLAPVARAQGRPARPPVRRPSHAKPRQRPAPLTASPLPSWLLHPAAARRRACRQRAASSAKGACAARRGAPRRCAPAGRAGAWPAAPACSAAQRHPGTRAWPSLAGLCTPQLLRVGWGPRHCCRPLE